MRKTATYDAGTYLLCRSGGVWRVEYATEGAYVLSALEKGEKKRVPLGSGEILRPLCSKAYIEEVIDRAGFVPTLQAPNDKLLKSLYQAALSECDELQWMRILKTAARRRKSARLFPGEEEFEEKAKAFLHGEISVLLGIPFKEVESHIAAALKEDWP